MAKLKNRYSQSWLIWIFVVPLITGFVLFINYLLSGKNIALFNPKGLIAYEQYNLMFFTVTVLIAIAVPALFLAFFIAWKYRESNTKATHSTDANQSKFLVIGMWLVPTLIMLVLASAMLPATQRLAPQKAIADTKPLTIQVISLRWKWLFIYPDQGIATVNFVQVPLNTPVEFEMTADETPMSSFWIPNLGGQLYTMTGHVNRLNLIADTPGDYPGSSAELNGVGFAGMKFTARASHTENFDQWVQAVKQYHNVLDTAAYENLLQPSENSPHVFYSNYESDLYDKVVSKYSRSTEGQMRHE